MRVGIVSLYGNFNMGNKLQNYALAKALEEYAEYVLTIKNKPIRKNLIKYFVDDSNLANTIFFSRLIGNARRSAIVDFNNKHLTCTRKTYRSNIPLKQLKAIDQCQMYCAGSDQVWGPVKHKEKMFVYLGFAERDRTFSYAASFGVDNLLETHKESVRKGLNHIKFLSVREDAGKRIVEELTGRTDVQVLVDPTMLLTPAQWDEVAEKPRKELPEKYLLTYFLGEVSAERRAAIEAKAKELGCKTIWLMDKQSPFYAIGPGHFVYLIKHAQMVCTDSFHGSVFSFLYGRPLAIYDRKGSGENMSSRLETLAAKFSLRGQMVQDENLEAIPVEPDYSAGYLALEEERKRSKAFLDMVFEEAERAGLCR